MVRLGIEERTLRVSEDQRSSTNGSVVPPYSSMAKDEKSSETNKEKYGHYNTHKITRTERIVFVSFFVYSSKSKKRVYALIWACSLEHRVHQLLDHSPHAYPAKYFRDQTEHLKNNGRKLISV